MSKVEMIKADRVATKNVEVSPEQWDKMLDQIRFIEGALALLCTIDPDRLDDRLWGESLFWVFDEAESQAKELKSAIGG